MFIIGLGTFVTSILYSVLLILLGELLKNSRGFIEYFTQKKFDKETYPYKSPVENTLNTMGIILQVIAIITIVVVVVTGILGVFRGSRFF
ncbi:MAG: hypothetical protein MK212_14780 [Saprospiraceae bacterium]|nr:hypothetical protein [Saprospiraceae bacterium]